MSNIENMYIKWNTTAISTNPRRLSRAIPRVNLGRRAFAFCYLPSQKYPGAYTEATVPRRIEEAKAKVKSGTPFLKDREIDVWAVGGSSTVQHRGKQIERSSPLRPSGES
jgi:hypothetical protein